MHRRTFFRLVGAGAAASSGLVSRAPERASEDRTEVLIVGGGVGGCAAALAAARAGCRVILTEETDWIGGQLTQQAVPPDEHAWIETSGATRSYQAFRRDVRAYYRAWYPLTPDAQAEEALNPGRCAVSRLCHEPRVALAVLEARLAPYVSSGRLQVLRDTRPVGAETSGDRVDAVRLRNDRTGDERTVSAPYVLDATETGALLPMTGTEYVTGAESQDDTGELHAPAEANPLAMQAVTWCFAVSYHPGEDHTIDPPEEYAFWRSYVPTLQPAWPGRLLSWTYSHPITLEPRTLAFDPRPGAATEAFNLWTYRRLLDPSVVQGGAYPGGITLVNWPQNDYWLGPLYGVPAEEADRHLRGAMALSYALFYWMQTEAPRPDGGAGWPGLRLRGDLTGTDHGLAKRPYIRESRRLRAVFTVLEQHVGLDARAKVTGRPPGEITAAPFPDSVGVGSYRIDLHPSTGGRNYLDVASVPFEIPLGALLPRRVVNLLAAGKNLGVTHITNGCYRLHPVEWNVGEAAGLLAAHCLAHDLTPHQVREDPALLNAFQSFLVQQGIQLRW